MSIVYNVFLYDVYMSFAYYFILLFIQWGNDRSTTDPSVFSYFPFFLRAHSIFKDAYLYVPILMFSVGGLC